MCNYNHGRFLPDAVQALLHQRYAFHEIIILDDCSTDNSAEMIEGFASSYPVIKFLRNPRNMGVVHNLNRLIELASGDYICGTAADDVLLPGFNEASRDIPSGRIVLNNDVCARFQKRPNG
jgi:glycosyltransferase involved in cell wall biosynthesis